MIDAIKDIDTVAKIVRDVLNNNLCPDIKFIKICTPVGVDKVYSNQGDVPFRIIVAYDIVFQCWILQIDLIIDDGTIFGGDQFPATVVSKDVPEFDKDDIENAAVKLAHYINQKHEEVELAK